MASVKESIEVQVPLRTAYNQWTQFEQFPQFMDGVESVRQLDDTHLHWAAEVGGKRQEWDAEITQQEPDRRIAWRAKDGKYISGEVNFEPRGEDRTQIDVEFTYDAEGSPNRSEARWRTRGLATRSTRLGTQCWCAAR